MTDVAIVPRTTHVMTIEIGIQMLVRERANP
jgi:hypothetical protein